MLKGERSIIFLNINLIYIAIIYKIVNPAYVNEHIN